MDAPRGLQVEIIDVEFSHSVKSLVLCLACVCTLCLYTYLRMLSPEQAFWLKAKQYLVLERSCGSEWRWYDS